MGALTFAPPVGPSASEVSLVQVADLVAAARADIAGTLNDDEAHDALARAGLDPVENENSWISKALK